MKIRLIAIAILLFGGYFWAWSSAMKGYGNPGHSGTRDETGRYHGYHGSSFFYLGGPRYFGSSYSGRYGSPGGPGSVGRGPGTGK